MRSGAGWAGWIVLVLAAAPALGDAIIVTKAMTATTVVEIFVEEDSIRVEMEIGVNDLDGFKNLLPDELYVRLGHDPQPLAERLPRFLSEDWVIRGDETPIPGRIRSMEGRARVRRDEITGEPLPSTGDEEAVVFVVIEYPLDEKPSTLTLRPPRHPGGKFVSATIGFALYHLGLPVNDFRYLGQEETVDLDWEDPWYSKFRNRNLRRQYNAPINAFLYVENFEVRVEIIVRPRDLEQWIDLGLASAPKIPVEMQAEMKERIAAFLAEHIDLTVDGETVSPELDRIHFLRRTLRNSTVIDPPEEMDAVSATLGAIFIHPRPGLPQESTLTWDLFATKMPQVRAAATDEAGPLPSLLRPDDNILVWKNFLKNPSTGSLVELPPPRRATLSVPVASVLLGLAAMFFGARLVRRRTARGVAGYTPLAIALIAAVLAWPVARWTVQSPLAALDRMSQDDAGEVLGGLLSNVYRAFDYRDEGQIYDVLARSASGDLLTQVYLETRQSLELQSQGGARVKVKEVELLGVDPDDLGDDVGFEAACQWRVTGSVGHWGHIHQRTNRYDARITVKSVDEVWKITALELLDEERIS